MRILHIGKYYPPLFGGIERVNYDLVENLNKVTDCQVDELCFSHTVGNEHYYTPDNYKLFRIPIRAIKFSTPIPIGFFSTYHKIRNNYDIIHLHLPNPIASLAPLLIPTRAKIILHWHSDILKQKKLMLLYKPIQKMLLNKAERIIATSLNYSKASNYLKAYLPKVEVIPIGINDDYLQHSTEEIDRIRQKYKNKKIILSIGRLTYYKGFKYLIEAARYLKDDTIIIIGGSGELKDELEKYIKKLNVSTKVYLIGRIPQEQMGAYYKAASIFCLPSIMKTEAFGVVLLEALSMSLPIVACNIPGSGVNWVNRHEETGLNVPICDARALAKAINEILANPTLCETYAHNSRKRYEALFTRDTMINKTLKLYKDITSKSCIK